MLLWICSFDPESTRRALCTALSVQWPFFCTRFADAGLHEMQKHLKLSSRSLQSKNFIHGLVHVEAGAPYNGPLTRWQETTFAQHDLFGKAGGAYSIKVTAAHCFTSAVQVLSNLTVGGASTAVGSATACSSVS